MTFTIITKHGEQTFADKELVNISSKKGCDFVADFGFGYVLTVEYNSSTHRYSLLNSFNSKHFLFKGQPLPQRLEIDKMCKIMVKDSDEFICIKVVDTVGNVKVSQEDMTEQDVQTLYGNDINAAVKLKIEKRKAELEEARVAVVKQILFSIKDLKNKLSLNNKVSAVTHIALLFASFVLAFGVANYLTGLPLKDAGSIIQMPVNMKIVFIYAIVIYGIGLIAKQGTYLYFRSKTEDSIYSNNIAESIMIIGSALLYAGLYCINLLYYMAPGSMPFFAIFMSLFFVAAPILLAVASGYYKSNKIELLKELNKYEYREDFESIMNNYQQWIERLSNSFSTNKIKNIKDKQFMLQIKSVGETLLGIVTAPFLAYGVSNTLAMCFPEAAGWVRISGLRFSPIFLVLATFMIVFAFFAFVNAFLCNKKIQASNVLKYDGFSNYLKHGVEIYGVEGIKKLETDMHRSFIIGLCIIFIEFSMNISFFMQEMGGDLGGMFLSSVAALVPTALLIAETYMLSQTKFEIHACDELVAKIDRE